MVYSTCSKILKNNFSLPQYALLAAKMPRAALGLYQFEVHVNSIAGLNIAKWENCRYGFAYFWLSKINTSLFSKPLLAGNKFLFSPSYQLIYSTLWKHNNNYTQYSHFKSDARLTNASREITKNLVTLNLVNKIPLKCL